jgi:hypothetical protein
MGSFLTALEVEHLPDGTKRLKAPLVYRSEALGRVLEVPEGFLTDFASVPRLPFAYWLAGGIGDEAAVVHDFLYRMGMVPRDLADKVYREALRASKVSGWRRGLMWAGVRLFGRPAYRGKK